MKQILNLVFCATIISIHAQENLKPGVEHINLSNKNIYKIPDSIIKNPNVRSIDFSNNPFFDLPEGIKMPGVTQLDLNHTSINTWQIDRIGSTFPNLEQLNLSNCQLLFIGSPLQTFGKLTTLNLSNNELETIPMEFQSLRNLQNLNLDNNNLSKGTGALGYLWKLKALNIQNNPDINPNDVLLALSLNENIDQLAIDGGKLTSKGVQYLTQSNIHNLSLNQLEKELPAGMIEMTQLGHLTISNSPDFEDSKNQLAGLKKLEHLTLNETAIPLSLQKQSKIDSLEVNASAALWAENLVAIGKNKSLKYLDISQSEYDPKDPETLRTNLPTTKIVTGKASQTTEMLSNSVPTILEEKITSAVIDPTIENVVTVKQTTFEIPENAFLLANGQQYNGPVNVSVKMYDNPFGMALEGVGMTYNENGSSELFSSNGMIDFRAQTPDGTELFPNPDQQIMVTMPNLQPNTPTELFNYIDSTNTWVRTPGSTLQPINPNQDLQRLIDSINKIDFVSRVSLSDITPLFGMEFKYKRNDPSTIRFISYRYNEFNKNNASDFEYVNSFKDQPFQIDTIINEQTAKYLKKVATKSRTYSKRKLKDGIDPRSIPRNIYLIDIVPDLAHDNYRLSFMVKDSILSYPISLSGTSNLSIQYKYRSFEKDRGQAYRAMNEQNQYFRKYRDSLIAIQAESMRRAAVQQLTSTYNYKIQSQELLRFGLSNFGLVNCDFFSRVVPTNFIRLPKLVRDQDNKDVELPVDVRVVIPSQNTYVNVSSDNVPIYENKKNYGIANFGANLIGVFVLFGSTVDVNKIKLIDISGKDPDEVRKLIESGQ